MNDPELRQWMGRSAVVDYNGDPQLVYHGTVATFNKFDLRKSGSKTDPGMLGKGIYFGSKSTAQSYGPVLIKAYLRVINPYRITEMSIEDVSEYLGVDSSILTVGGTSVKVLAPFAGQFTAAVKDKGHDGIMTDYEIVVYDANQICVVTS